MVVDSGPLQGPPQTQPRWTKQESWERDCSNKVADWQSWPKKPDSGKGCMTAAGGRMTAAGGRMTAAGGRMTPAGGRLTAAGGHMRGAGAA